jgi:diaminopimelate decarboxylase
MSNDLSTAQLTAIADEFGTPVYVYHLEKIAIQ